MSNSNYFLMVLKFYKKLSFKSTSFFSSIGKSRCRHKNYLSTNNNHKILIVCQRCKRVKKLSLKRKKTSSLFQWKLYEDASNNNIFCKKCTQHFSTICWLPCWWQRSCVMREHQEWDRQQTKLSLLNTRHKDCINKAINYNREEVKKKKKEKSEGWECAGGRKWLMIIEYYDDYSHAKCGYSIQFFNISVNISPASQSEQAAVASSDEGDEGSKYKWKENCWKTISQKRYKNKKILFARLFVDGNGIDGDMMYRKFVVEKRFQCSFILFYGGATSERTKKNIFSLL